MAEVPFWDEIQDKYVRGQAALAHIDAEHDLYEVAAKDRRGGRDSITEQARTYVRETREVDELTELARDFTRAGGVVRFRP